MSTNVGSADRTIRLVLAVAALVGAWAVGFTNLWGIVLAVVAVVLATTALMRFCPIYRLLGTGTCRR